LVSRIPVEAGAPLYMALAVGVMELMGDPGNLVRFILECLLPQLVESIAVTLANWGGCSRHESAYSLRMPLG
jgi:hypothetical protein